MRIEEDQELTTEDTEDAEEKRKGIWNSPSPISD
jgi:hypothetical protein